MADRHKTDPADPRTEPRPDRPDDAKRAPKTEPDPAAPSAAAVYAPIPAAPDGNPPPVPPENPVTTEPRADARTPATPPADAGPEPDGPVEWAADLVRELGKTGTGAAKLDKVRRAMVERHNDPAHAALAPDHPDRHLSAREGLAVLEADPEVGELTRQKARALVEAGRYVPAAAATLRPADALPPPPKGKAPHREAKPKEPGKPADAGQVPAPPARARVAVDQPGVVRDLAAGAVETTGPKPAGDEGGKAGGHRAKGK